MVARDRTQIPSRPLPLVVFLLLALVITWAFWVPSALVGAQQPLLPLEPGLYGPSIASVVVLWAFHGRAAVGYLLSGLLVWRVHWFWYAFVLLLPIILAAIAWMAEWSLTGQPADWADAAIYDELPEGLAAMPMVALVPLVFLITLIGAPLGEEIGWRGYALPRLQAWISPLSAGLLVGTVWGIWHLPLFWMQFMAHAEYPIGGFMINIILASVLFAWVFNATGGSILLVVLFHAAQNVVSAFAPVSHHVSLPAAVVAFVLVLLLVLSGRLSQAPSSEGAQ